MDEKRYKTDFLIAQPSLLSGTARIFDLFGTFDDYNSSSSPGEADARAMNNDWNVALQDYRDAVDEAKVRMTNGQTQTG